MNQCQTSSALHPARAPRLLLSLPYPSLIRLTSPPLPPFSLPFPSLISASPVPLPPTPTLSPQVFFTVDRADSQSGWKGGVGFISADMLKKALPPPSADSMVLVSDTEGGEEPSLRAQHAVALTAVIALGRNSGSSAPQLACGFDTALECCKLRGAFDH